ncbi:MAG TPA: nuclear transport factor 2 family protein [Candidatus Binatia bacterium]|nr:nuclear transport factor 2 family protein [Candidatus Binatia bacterium]
MTREEALRFAERWVDAWNARDLETVLGFFDEAARFTSPKAAALVGEATVAGTAALRDYWTRALARARTLRFTLDHVVWDGHRRQLVIVYAAAIDGQRTHACELLRFGAGGRIVEGEAMYGVALPPETTAFA